MTTNQKPVDVVAFVNEQEERLKILQTQRKEVVNQVLLANPQVAALDGAIGELMRSINALKPKPVEKQSPLEQKANL